MTQTRNFNITPLRRTCANIYLTWRSPQSLQFGPSARCFLWIWLCVPVRVGIGGIESIIDEQFFIFDAPSCHADHTEHCHIIAGPKYIRRLEIFVGNVGFEFFRPTSNSSVSSVNEGDCIQNNIHVSRVVVLVQECVHSIELIARRVIDVIRHCIRIAELVQ